MTIKPFNQPCVFAEVDKNIQCNYEYPCQGCQYFTKNSKVTIGTHNEPVTFHYFNKPNNELSRKELLEIIDWLSKDTVKLRKINSDENIRHLNDLVNLIKK